MSKFIPLLLFFILAWFFYDGLGRDTKTLPSPLIGKVFPSMQVEDFNTQEKYDLSDKMKGSISLVNVWASWCVTCREEHQSLLEIANTNNIKMIGVNYKDSRKNGQDFLNNFGNPYELIVFDEFGKLGLELGVYATPETFIMDADGIIIFKQIGALTQDIWIKTVVPKLRKLTFPTNQIN